MVYFYTRDSVKKNAASSWNREHVWPQSLSKGCWGTDGAGTDLLHIRPTYESTNSSRGNLKYGYVTNGNPQTYNSMQYGSKDSSYFEPLPSVRGDCARIIMYVWTAWHDYYGSNLPAITKVISYNTLLRWHIEDQPDALEGNRNDYAESSLQKNRNPFVDHPEFAWQIFGGEASESVLNEAQTAYPANASWNASDPVSSSESPNGQTSAEPSGSSSIQSPNPSGNVFELTFPTSGSDGSSELSASTLKTYAEKNTLVSSFSNPSKCYSGSEGLKLGSSKAVGSFSATLVPEAQHQISRIAITSAQYSNDSSTIRFSVNGEPLGEDFVPGEDFVFDASDSPLDVSNFQIQTIGKRAYLCSVVFTMFDEQEASSSSEPADEPSSSEPSSEPSYDSSSSASEEPASETLSESSPSSEEEPSSFEESNEEEENKTGIIVAAAVGGSIGLGGIGALVWLLVKKRI